MAPGDLPPVVEDPGSFRDPTNRVFYRGDEVLRALSEEGARNYAALRDSGLMAEQAIVRTEVLADSGPASEGLSDLTGVEAILRHDRVPFVSYPYEWSFSMLQAAAVLQLDLLLAAVPRGLMLKDASPYNVQFDGTSPTFIDVGSFEPLREQDLWTGYRQFCMLQLFPLLLQAGKGLPFQPWLRGSLEGITPEQVRAVASWSDLVRRGWFTHVFLHARLERKRSSTTAPRSPRALQRPGVGTSVILANVARMRRTVSRLRWVPPDHGWTTYGEHSPYSDEDATSKDAFVRHVAGERRWPLVWDLGANNARHSRLVAPVARQVLAIDADAGTVERTFHALRGSTTRSDARVLPLVIDLAAPSPALGWRGSERKSLLQRGRPDLVLALALIHHLVITANIPVRDVVRWLGDLGAAVVVEFPHRGDPMVRGLLARKRPGLHGDYEQATFERHLVQLFDIRRTEQLRSGTRTLYYATPRAGHHER